MLAVFNSRLVHYSSGCYAGYNVQPGGSMQYVTRQVLGAW